MQTSTTTTTLTPSALPKVVSRNRWFASLTAAQQTALLAVTKRVVLRDGQLLVAQGQSVRKRRDGMFLLVSGSVKLCSSSTLGKEAVLGFVQPGQWFGELALLDGLQRERDIRSVGVSEVLIVESEAFAELMKDPQFARRVGDLMTARARMLLSLVEDFTLRSARARTARRLVLLAYDDDTRSTHARKELGISHDALASMLGMTRQTLASQLKGLAEVGAIAQGYSRIFISSMVVLMAEASGI
jgi:CRP/FNR family transcriptional regulator, cyclic AMP receptor protein